MALVFMDGFEIDFANKSVGLWDVYGAPHASPSIDYRNTAAGLRTGNGCLYYDGQQSDRYAYLYKDLPSTYTELYFGFGFYTTLPTTNSGTNQCEIISFRNSTTGIVSLAIDDISNYLYAVKGTGVGTVVGTYASALPLDEIHYIEAHVVISASVGVFQVKLNGTLVIDESSLNLGATAINRVYIGSTTGAGATRYYDDLLINDATGTVCNSWPNGAGIEILTPSADGNYTAWTSTGGAVDYTEIDDVASYGGLPDGVTTNILSQTTDQRTSVTLSNTTLVGDVLAVSIRSNLRNDGPATDSMEHFVRLSSTDYDHTTFAPTAAYAWRTDNLTLNPATAAQWTTAELDGMEVGFHRVT